jgi:hypothetical protein
MVDTHLTPRRSRAKLVVLHRRVLGGRPSAGGSRAEPRSHWRYAVSTGSTSRDPAGAGAAHNRVVPGGDGDWVACGDISGGGQIRGVATPPPRDVRSGRCANCNGSSLGDIAHPIQMSHDASKQHQTPHVPSNHNREAQATKRAARGPPSQRGAKRGRM